MLDQKALEAEACRREGAEAVPGEEWRKPFGLLVRELEETAALSPIGQQIANGQLVTLLRMRIRAERTLRRYPEIGERPLSAPVIILGHMRSGTTRLHRLLAQDPQFAHTRHFESLEPVPSRGRRLRAGAIQAFLEQANPVLGAIHPTAPLEPEEEWGLHSYSWHGAQMLAQWHVPGFAAYQRRRDLAVPYAEFAMLLRLIGWSRGDSPDKPWLLKSPQFMGDLHAVLRQFPDATLLCLRRDPVAVAGSSASLVWNQRRLHNDHADPEQVGREWLEQTIWRERQAQAARECHPHVPQLEVDFDEVSSDWEGAVRRIYDFLHRPLSAAALGRMRRYMARPARHLGHRYRLEDFGLGEEEVRRALEAARPGRTFLLAADGQPRREAQELRA